jgi:hypothetical protein
VPVTFRTHGNGNRAVFTNDDGDWHVWLRPTQHPRTGAVVGPGHIGRVVAADGTLIVDDYFHADPNLNDGRNGGLGSFGCHISRRNEHFPDGYVWNYTWNLTARMDARSNGFGISRAFVLDGPRIDGNGVGRLAVASELSDMYSFPKPIILLRHTYLFRPKRVEQQVDVAAAWDGSGPALFVKEPKLTCHSVGPVGGPRYRYFSVFARNGDALLRNFDIWSLPNPMVRTKQLPYPRRCRFEFLDEHRERPLNAVMMGYGSEGRAVWHGGPGLDKWARDANGRERLLSRCNAYCLQGPKDAEGRPTLTRKWELGRWASAGANSPPDPEKPHAGAAFHAWEGGIGPPDCHCATRAIPPFGTTYQSWACYSLGDGWIT